MHWGWTMTISKTSNLSDLTDDEINARLALLEQRLAKPDPIPEPVPVRPEPIIVNPERPWSERLAQIETMAADMQDRRDTPIHLDADESTPATPTIGWYVRHRTLES
jgi:hypothetical protein